MDNNERSIFNIESSDNNDTTIEAMFEKMQQNVEDDNEEDFNFVKKAKIYTDKKANRRVASNAQKHDKKCLKIKQSYKLVLIYLPKI
jgi:hypothetical protein